MILGFQFPAPTLRLSYNGTEYMEYDSDPERHLSLCMNCEDVLGNLYKVFRLFTGLSNGKESFILHNSLISGRILEDEEKEWNGVTGEPVDGDGCIEIQGDDVEVICIESETFEAVPTPGQRNEELIVPHPVQSPTNHDKKDETVELITLEDEDDQLNTTGMLIKKWVCGNN